MEFQERAIHRPDLVFLDEMMLELDELEQENDLIEQENWEDMGLVFFHSRKNSFKIFDDIGKFILESKSENLVQNVNFLENF